MRRTSLLAFALVVALPLALLSSKQDPAPTPAKDGDKLTKSVAKGLEWLSKHQNSDGGWGCGVPKTASSTCITGLACLALMSNGATPTSGEYSDMLREGLQWLIDRGKRANGALIGVYVTEMGNAYDHSCAMIALAMAYGMWREKAADIRDVIDGGLKWLDRQQNPDGGWTRYGGNSTDPAVTANAWVAYRAASSIGVEVKTAEDKIEKFVRSAAMRRFGGGGTTGAGSQYINDLAGWLRMRLAMGDGDKDVRKAAELVVKNYLTKDKPRPVSEWDYVALFHLGPAFFHDKAAWEAWWPGASGYLMDIQNGDGSWNIINCIACKAFATSLALIFLQTPKQVVPLGDL